MTVHLLTTPRVLGKLRAELTAALPDVSTPPRIKDIEQLPYLSAVITEGLRLAIGTSQRQTRISPSEIMTYSDGDSEKQWHIPPGVRQAPPLRAYVTNRRSRPLWECQRHSFISTQTSSPTPWSSVRSALSRTRR